MTDSGGRRPNLSWFARPVVLVVVAVLLAVGGLSTIAYAVARPDPNRPPVGAGTLDAGPGVPAPDVVGALTAPTRSAASPSSPSGAASVTSGPGSLPTATVVPFGARPTGTPGPTATATATPTTTAKTTARTTAKTRATPKPTAAPGPALPAPLDTSAPVRVVIPAIGVDRRPISLGLTKGNELQTPTNAHDLGWWNGGPTPGSIGAAVIAGHVSYNMPGVFYRLATLHRGDRVEVARKDGTTAIFTVSGVKQYPKDRFPTQDVYGFVDRAALRLITCGGTFDPKTRHFEENIVVYADMTSVRG